MARLGDIATYVNGFAFKPSDWSNEGLPIIRIQDLTGNSYQANRYNGSYHPKYEVNDGDVLISWSASLGVYVWKGEKAVLNQHIFKVVFDKTEVDKNFFVHQVQNILENAASEAHGATMKHLTKPVFDALPFYLPSIEKQKEIASVLDKVTELIALRKEQLAKLDQLVKSQFIELFGDPETNPNRWSISKLSEFCDLQNGYAFKSDDYLTNSTVLNCRMSNIRPDGGFDADYHPKYLPDMFWEKYKDYRLVDGDVIIAMTDMASDPKILGVPTIVRTNGKRFLLNQRVGKLTFFDNTAINNVYLMFVLSQKHIRQQLVKSAGGSTQINVGKPAVLGVEFFVPPMKLQEQFAAFVEQTDKSKLAIQQSLGKLELLKKSLMQEYFG